MKKLIAHPEWDVWLILIAVLTPLLAVLIAVWLSLHGKYSVLLVFFGIVVPVTAILILSEARNARKWLVQVSRSSTLRGYMSIKLSLGLLLFGVGIIWGMVTPGGKPAPLIVEIGTPFMLYAIGFALLRRSRLSPWAIPEVELAPAGLALPRPTVRGPDNSNSWKTIKRPGGVCLVPWDCVESVDWVSEGRAGPQLYVKARKTVWFKNWGAKLRGAPATELEQVVTLKAPLQGDTIPPDALVLAAQRYMEYAKK